MEDMEAKPLSNIYIIIICSHYEQISKYNPDFTPDLSLEIAIHGPSG